jgi:hypothetical protein
MKNLNLNFNGYFNKSTNEFISENSPCQSSGCNYCTGSNSNLNCRDNVDFNMSLFNTNFQLFLSGFYHQERENYIDGLNSFWFSCLSFFNPHENKKRFIPVPVFYHLVTGNNPEHLEDEILYNWFSKFIDFHIHAEKPEIFCKDRFNNDGCNWEIDPESIPEFFFKSNR